MIEETKTTTSDQGLAASGTDLVEEASALTEMGKKVTALEAQNAELMAAKKKYYDAILNGSSTEDNGPKERTRDEIRKDLFGRKDKDCMSNLEYAKLVVELDDACIREQGESCFLPKGKDVTPTVDERSVAERLHNALKESIDESEGDNELFNQAFARRIKRK